MTLNEDENKIHVQYLFTEDVLRLTDNKGQAIGYQRSVERKLIKKGEIDQYNEELRSSLNKGYLKKLENDDLQEYKGPISYVGHHPVYKLESKTTPLRVVCNSSLKIRIVVSALMTVCLSHPIP